MIDIFAQLTQFTGIGQDWFLTAVLVFLRVGAALAVMPAFGEQVVPQRVRLVVALAFTAIVGPAVAPDRPQATVRHRALPVDDDFRADAPRQRLRTFGQPDLV